MKLLGVFNFLSQNDPANPGEGDFWRNAGRIKAKVLGVIQSLAFITDIPTIRRLYHFSYMLAAATAPSLPFGKVTTSTGNRLSSFPTTDPANGGIADGNIDSYVVLNNCIAKRIRITIGQAAVQQLSVGPTPVMRLSLWKAGLSGSRTFLSNFDTYLTIQSGAIGTNNKPANVYATGMSVEQTVNLEAGDVIGLQFESMNASSNWIVSAGRMIAVLETEE